MSEAMTPFMLKILLHYYTSPDDYDGSGNPKAVGEAIKQLSIVDLLSTPECRITERGRAHIEWILRLPLPIQVWVSPCVYKMTEEATA